MIKLQHFSVLHHQTNNIGFQKGSFKIYKYKFFQIFQKQKVPKPNISKYFKSPEVQIQIEGENLKPWLNYQIIVIVRKIGLKKQSLKLN